MITNLVINLIILFVGSLFTFLPSVSTLPTFFGFDIDSALVNGVGQLNTFLAGFWYLKYPILGFLFLLGYYAIKLVVRFFLGSRSPGLH